MGREKKGGSGRSKSRPSSSSLAAAHPGAAPLGFGGYVGSSLVETTFSAEREVSQDLDGEAALQLKRLSKRDPTTKLKALAALRGIFKERSVDELAAILLTWVFEYKRLVLDNNRQVRENTHGAMADLTTNAGRGLARHLRSLMGAWWVSQFDPSKEVAEAAQRSFQVTFPDRKKRVDVLIFCLKDIMTHLDENLKLNPQMLTEIGTSPEEVAEKLERFGPVYRRNAFLWNLTIFFPYLLFEILSSSLLALAALLDVLVGSSPSLWKEGPAESTSAAGAAVGAGDAVKEAATSLFYEQKSFQSSVKNKSSQVRSAVYQTLRTYVQHIPQVFSDEDNLDNSVNLVLGALGEKVTSCHQPMWDMILLFSKKLPQAWGSISISKVVLPKLWDFLKQGCFGSQQISYPCMYPLLALIPPQFVTSPQDFFLEFFKNLWQGVYMPVLSTADRLSLFTTFQECFAWVVKNAKRYAKDADCKILQDFLVEEVLLKIVWCQYASVANQSLLENSSLDQDFSNAVTNSAHLQPVLPPPVWDDVANTIVDILILLGQEEGVLDSFWPGFQTACVSILLDTSSENASRLTRLGDLFSVLHVKIPEIEKTSNAWLLLNAVQPFVEKGFPAIRRSGHPEALRLLGKLIATYGTFAFTSREQILGDIIRRQFLQEVVPWCLSGEEKRLVEPKIDLLLSFFEVKEFHDYWKSTIECATAWLRPYDERIDLDDNDLAHVGVLATLVGKFSEKWVRLTKPAGNVAEDDAGINVLDLWRLPRIDAAGLAVARSSNLIHPECVRLLRSFLSPQNPEESLLSSAATAQLLEMLSNHLIEVLPLHDTSWARAAPSFILSDSVDKLNKTQSGDVEESISFELARSALEVVEVSMPTLGALQLEPSGTQLLSTLFCLYWAFLKPSPRKVNDGDSDESEDERREEDTFPNSDGGEERALIQEVTSSHHIEQSRFSFLNSLETLRRSSPPAIYRKLRAESRERIRRVLTEVVRSALVSEESSDVFSTSALSADWVCEMVEYFCVDENEIQDTISCTLAPRLSWPTWVADTQHIDNTIPIVKFPRQTTLVEEEVHQRFCAYADVLATYLGPETVYNGRTSMSVDTGNGEYRIWLVIELLCSWEWPGGSAALHLFEFLCDTARNATGQKIPPLLDMCFRSLLAGSASESSDRIAQEGPVEDDLFLEMGPSTNALLTLLRALLDGEAVWKREDVEQFFSEYIAKSSNADDLVDAGLLKVLPSVLLILMPVLRNPLIETSDAESLEKEGWALKQTVCDWLNKALSLLPRADVVKGCIEFKGKQWLEVAISCYPLQLPGLKSGIAAAASAKISLQETSLLLRLLRRQFSMAQYSETQLISADTTDVMLQLGLELTLARLVAVSVAYCWQDFSVEEWAFILKCLRKWVDSAVVEYEEMTEIIVSFHKDGQQGDLDLQQLSGRKILIELAATAVSVLILLKDLSKLETVTALRAKGVLRVSNWVAVEDHMMEALLRILLATGLSEATALDFDADSEAANTISKHRMAESSLWESLAVVALGATTRAREAAVRAADLWGVGKGSISALYALLLSPNSSGALRWVAFEFLSTEPIQQLAVTWGGASQNQEEVEDAAPQDEASLAAAAKLRPELIKLLETPEKLLLQTSFTSSLRVQYLLGWSLLLMRLHALPLLSPTRERLLLFARDSDTSSTLLDCLFQHIPLDLTSGTSASRRRTAAAGAKISVAATSATRAVSSGTVGFAVESLWPVKEQNVVVLAGAVYGLLLRVLPACVRIWFTGLRDRSTVSAIENFTSSNCSTHLLADEFSQLQASVVADETLSIRANRTLREVTAVYKKEEACLDIVIRLPACYPLRAVEVDCTRRLGISKTLVRKWILSMASFLRNQNGALLEAIQMWKKNVDREFEGVEECPICYSIIHTTNHSLPRLACKTCKHKFHSACLYKWFSSSHKSTCPLCQTPF